MEAEMYSAPISTKVLVMVRSWGTMICQAGEDGTATGAHLGFAIPPSQRPSASTVLKQLQTARGVKPCLPRGGLFLKTNSKKGYIHMARQTKRPPGEML